jgi:arsenate reductase (glutaredoxin)
VTIDLYGISNCDTVRKARAWLEGRGLAYRFHDFKKEGAAPESLELWERQLGWEALLNRRGTTFRALPDEARTGLDRDRALELMQAHPSLIRRPVVEHPAGVLVGFDPAQWERALA